MPTRRRPTTVPERVRWAVDVLDPLPADKILEVGGGTGVSAGLICEPLTTGMLLAVDRSAAAVQRTEQRNAEHVAAGRLTVKQCELGALDVPAYSFDKVLTLNVNLFWVKDPKRELAVLSRALRPGGILHILHGTGPTSGDRVTDRVAKALRENGFVDVTAIDAKAGFGVSARRPL